MINEALKRTKTEARTKPIEFVGVIVLIFYTVFSGYQSCQMREANRLNYAALKSSQAAVLRIGNGNPSWSNPAVFNFTLINEGQLRAKDVRAHVEIAGESLPDLRVLESSTYDVGGNGEFVKPSDSLNFHRSLPLPRGMGVADYNRIEEMKEMFIFKGTLQYDDGLGETTTQAFCISLMHLDRPAPNGTEGFQDCDSIPGLLTRFQYGDGTPKR